MKTHYFEQPAADQDDATLKEMIGQGRVPATCLLGGVMVQSYAKLGIDPCTRCLCPRRDACKGRDRSAAAELEDIATVPAANAASRIVNDEAGARKVQRQSFMTQFREMALAAERERDKK